MSLTPRVPPGAPPRPAMLAPFRVRSFRFQWPADLATSWAAEMEVLALGWFVLAETGSVLLLAVFASLPFLGTLVAPAFGVVGDRIGHRNLLCAMRALYLLLASVLLVLAATGLLTPVHAFAVAALGGVVRASDMGLRNVLISETMPPERLMGALGLSRITADSARVIGPLAGAGMVAGLGMAWAYGMIVALYGASVLLTRGVAPRPRPAGPPVARASPWGELRQAARLVRDTPPQMAAMCLAFLINLTAYPFVLGLLPYVAREVYGSGQAALGLLSASAALGCVAAALLISRLGQAVLPGRVMMAAALAWHALTIALGLTTGMAGGVAVLLLAGLAQAFCIVPMSVLQLRNAPAELRGRVMGLRTLAVYGLPIGLWIAGPLIGALGFAATATLYGAVGLAGTLAILLRWRAHLWPAAAPANAPRESP
ncbi:MFS transporter [Falsiroseomonas sp. CW058]|uniref:MFS transporter n=1 Tax=Falsiroseomonas sp. CW058 TaxID=3388664 RepID=UPI003D317FE5